MPIQPNGLARRLPVALLAGVVFVVVSVGLAQARIPQGRSGVGDSIMLSSKDELQPLGYAVHAEEGRQFSVGLSVLRWLANHDKLPKRVVVHLGTNGTIAADGCDELVGITGKRTTFVVTIKVPRTWQDPNNELLRACARAKGSVYLIDWYDRAVGHPRWFASDKYHLTALGQAEYTAFIDRRVDAVVAKLAA
jgi:hypothetical protein